MFAKLFFVSEQKTLNSLPESSRGGSAGAHVFWVLNTYRSLLLVPVSSGYEGFDFD